MSLVRVCLCVLQENDICSFPVIATKRPKFSLDKGWCASFQSLALSVYDGMLYFQMNRKKERKSFIWQELSQTHSRAARNSW